MGLLLAAALLAAAVLVPILAEWDVRARKDSFGLPPIHGFWETTVGVGTLPAVALAVLGVLWAPSLAARLRWRPLLVLSFAVALAWLVSLALVDGAAGLERTMTNDTEYLLTARSVDDVGALLGGYIDHIPLDSTDNWPIHVAGHPPGALLFFVGLVRVGLGGELAAALVVCVVAATIPAAVLVTLRRLGAEDVARRALPFLVLSPAAVFLAVSGDALFTAFACWGLAALATAATSSGRTQVVIWSVVAGLLLGWCVLSSYGLVLLGLVALAVLAAARSWWPLPIAAAAALMLVLGFAVAGFAWWEAYPVLVDRYWDGLASERPSSYWLWGNLAALVVSAGPMVCAGLAWVVAHGRRAGPRPVLLLVGAAVATIVLADLSMMSKAETERIWLPWVPWLTLSLALLPDRWQRPALAVQVGFALLVQHLVYTTW